MGLAVSVALLWLSARNVQFDRAWRYVQDIDLFYLVPSMLLITGAILLRALKWQVLLRPVKHCSFWKLNSATLMGLMANNVLPARAGEFVRAYAGARLESIPYSMAFATVVIDRVLDGLSVSAIFLLVVLFHPLPEEVKGAGYLAAAIYAGALMVLLGLIVRQGDTIRLIAAILRPLPPALQHSALHATETFVGGLGVFRSAPLLTLATLISFAIWAGFTVSLYLMFRCFRLELSASDALVLLLILTIVLTLPSSPGFVGAVEWGTVFGLGLFGVSESQAFALAVVNHVTQYVLITAAGFAALWFERLSMTDIAHATQQR